MNELEMGDLVFVGGDGGEWKGVVMLWSEDGCRGCVVVGCGMWRERERRK